MSQPLTIQVKSAAQIDVITLDAVAVETLFPGTPGESVAMVRDLIANVIQARARVGDAAETGWIAEHITVAT